MRYLTKDRISKEILNKIFNLKEYLSGSTIVFAGRVRKDKIGKNYVKEIIYESYEKMAEKEIKKIEKDAKKKFKVKKIFIKHRTGKVKIGEISFLVAVLSSHREEGFKALKFIIDKIKEKVPIWKKEILNNKKYRWK